MAVQFSAFPPSSIIKFSDHDTIFFRKLCKTWRKANRRRKRKNGGGKKMKSGHGGVDNLIQSLMAGSNGEALVYNSQGKLIG